MDYLCTADRSLALDRFYHRLHFQALRRGHFSTPYNGHRVQPIQNDLQKPTVKVPPTKKLYIMWRFVRHLEGWPFAPCSQCKGGLNSARLVQIRSRSSVTFQSSFFKRFVLLYFRLKSACFCFAFYAADTNFKIIL